VDAADDGPERNPRRPPHPCGARGPGSRGTAVRGTEFGIFVSLDNGRAWQPFQLNLPHTPITDLKVHRKDLVLSTQGRSFWILDNLTPLHQLRNETVRGAHLVRPRETVRFRYPAAALLAFCVGLVSYNVFATLKAALRSVHGEEVVEQEVSMYYLTDEIAGTYRGMRIAIAEAEWEIFRDLSTRELSDLLRRLVGAVKLCTYRKRRRVPRNRAHPAAMIRRNRTSPPLGSSPSDNKNASTFERTGGDPQRTLAPGETNVGFTPTELGG
jgi:hypothetical protein